MPLRFKTVSPLTIVSILLFMGAGCVRPAPTPNYLKDAREYRVLPTRPIAPTSSPSVPTPPPALVLASTSEPTASAGIPDSVSSKTSATSKTPATPSADDYARALNVYRTTGAYYQLVNCRGTPGTLTMKKGTRFMIDNRDPAAHSITIGSQHFTIAAYGFTILTASGQGLRYLTCDGGGSAAIIVQP